MCFSSLQERQLHNEKQKEKRKARRCTWVWCLEMNKCRHKSLFLLFDSHFLCSFFPSPPFFLFFSWCVCSHFCWGYMSHLFPLGVTVTEPSSHCVHPKFPFQDASYSKPYLVKNKPQKMKWDVEMVIQGKRGGREMEWTDVEKLFHASFSSSRYPLNVADCATDKSEKYRFSSTSWNWCPGGQRLSFHASV